MKKLLLFFTFGLILNGDQVDEMEELILNHESLIIHPEKLYKDGGIWLTETKNVPFTGRVEIYAEKDEKDKILEDSDRKRKFCKKELDKFSKKI